MHKSRSLSVQKDLKDQGQPVEAYDTSPGNIRNIEVRRIERVQLRQFLRSVHGPYSTIAFPPLRARS